MCSGLLYCHKRALCVLQETAERQEILRHEVGAEQYRLDEGHILVGDMGSKGTFAVSFERGEAAEEALAWITQAQSQLSASSEEEDSDFSLLPDVSTVLGLQETAQVFSTASMDLKRSLAASIIGTPFLTSLQSAFLKAELETNMPVLTLLFTIYKEMVHFCSPALTEILLSDVHFPTLLGALEKDPSLSGQTLSFRGFLSSVQFHNVLKLPPGRLLSQIHSNFRLLYLKDTAMARCLDESCLCFLASEQLNYAAEIVLEVGENREIRLKLIEKLREKDLEAYRLLGEIVAVLKQAQTEVKTAFLETICREGVLEIAVSALESRENEAFHSVISDFFLLLVTNSPAIVKNYCFSGSSEAKKRLITAIFDAFLSSSSVSALLDLSELLQTLLDPSPERQFQDLLDQFYDFQACKLLSALEKAKIDSEETRIRTIEVITLLIRCVQSHGYRIRTLLLESELIKRLKEVMEIGDKPVTLACIRLIREIAIKNDPFLVKILVKNEVFPSVWRLFLANGSQEGMLFSSILALIGALRSLSLPCLTQHLADSVQSVLQGSALLQHFSFLEKSTEKVQGSGEKRRKLEDKQGW